MKRAVLIADDHPLFRDALKLAVAQAVPGAQIVEADTVHSLFAALDAHPDPELLLLDLNMPGAHGFNALVQARANFPTVPIVVISAREDRSIMHRALGHGAAAFVPKSASIDLIVAALRAVLGGDTWLPASASAGGLDPSPLDQQELDATARLATLTPQQFRVLSMLSAGLLNKQIAAELNVSEATVKAHVSALMQKLGVSNRTQAVLLAQRLSLDQGSGDSTS
ncbi:response regulator transcription factor [Steroidobacter sp. S1-65]|uniref:Response regulator transcription factor n=1 Tax=Steroidobacter gossypii TaxID=2805490 RepID=A0ABS1WRS3_9GAMM|nr:response regulator transcription factor [Steroidobacter gossypii]MBM0103664.1 response regulator transcription factor [Steroidobacter gossypii]